MTPEAIAAETIEQLRANGYDAGRARLQRLIAEDLGYPRNEAIAYAVELLAVSATSQELTEGLQRLQK